ncbi:MULTISPECIES: hypothetical protein [Providencia]|uniref:hypothetical protein n=1 Tax=Providencia TaxID=586 RepID=UPI001BA9BB60|nr:hypothetical protein [Providencia rettgeri]MBS0918548.1 hypothetical protein [Providencia rettgeri]MDU7495945.1 hypothetical protein [Providencia rettgeri]
MNINLSKLCADFLRQNHASQSTEKLKASHARELVAAYFGYKSHAALMAEKTYSQVLLEKAYIFTPNIPLMNDRRSKLNGLPNDLPQSIDIAKLLSDMLADEGLCGGNVWIDSEPKYCKPTQSRLAAELGITDEDLESLEWDTKENSSDDGLIYDFVLTFDKSCPSEILDMIQGLSDNLTIRVSANAFDNLYPDENTYYKVPNISSKDQDSEGV